MIRSTPRPFFDSPQVGNLARSYDTIYNSSSPVRIQFEQDRFGLTRGSDVEVTVKGPHGEDVFAYALQTQRLGSDTFKRLNEILKAGLIQSTDPMEVFREIRRALGQSGDNNWSQKVLQPNSEFSALQSLTIPVIPSIDEFEKDPSVAGRSYVTTLRDRNNQVELRTFLKPEQGRIFFALKDVSHSKKARETIRLTDGRSITDPALCARYLNYMMYQVHEIFHKDGIGAVRRFLAKPFSERMEAVATASPQEAATPTLVIIRRLASGATIRLSLRPTASELTISNGRIPSRSSQDATSVCRWTFRKREELLPILENLVAAWADGPAVGALRKVVERAHKEAIRPALPERVLGRELFESLNEIKGITVSSVSPRSVEQLVGLLRGENNIKISIADPASTREHPQLFDTLLFTLGANAGAQAGGLEVSIQNRIGHRVSAQISAARLAQVGGRAQAIHTLTSKFAAQVDPSRHSQYLERIALLNSLNTLQDSWLLDDGKAHVPARNDILDHQMVDQLGVPLFNLFCQRTNQRHSESSITSTGRGSIAVVLGESWQPYALVIDINDSVVRNIRVVERQTYDQDEPILDSKAAVIFPVRIQLGRLDREENGMRTMEEVVVHFAELTAPQPDGSAKSFEKSTLKELLTELPREGRQN